jgi:hypothetical protein
LIVASSLHFSSLSTNVKATQEMHDMAKERIWGDWFAHADISALTRAKHRLMTWYIGIKQKKQLVAS